MVYLQNNKVKNATYELPIINSIDIGHNIKRFVTVLFIILCSCSQTSLLSNYQRNFMYSDPTKQKSILETISLHIPSSIFSTTNQDYITKYFNLGKQLGYGILLLWTMMAMQEPVWQEILPISIRIVMDLTFSAPFVRRLQMTANWISLFSMYSLSSPTHLQSDQLQSIGCNLLYSVGKGSISKSRLVLLKYKYVFIALHASSSGASDPSLPYTALVGKGITFDTGGLNLKPDSMPSSFLSSTRLH